MNYISDTKYERSEDLVRSIIWNQIPILSRAELKKCLCGGVVAGLLQCAGVGGAGKLCLGTSWWGRCWGWPVLGGVVLFVGGDGGLSAVWVMETGAVLLVIAVHAWLSCLC